MTPHCSLTKHRRQREGARGASSPRGPGDGDKRRSERSLLFSLFLTPAVSRRCCCTPGSPLPSVSPPKPTPSLPSLPPPLPTLLRRCGGGKEWKGEKERVVVVAKGGVASVWWSKRGGSLPKAEAKCHEVL